MANSKLSKLCMDEDDPMLRTEVRCKHGILLQMQTSWSDRNPGRRFWSCPHYEATNCKFFRWRDKEGVDERSKFILPRLVNKIKELEENYENIKMNLDEFECLKLQYENVDMNLVELEDSKEKKMKEMHLDELKSAQIQYENLNINTVELEDSEAKGDSKENDTKEKKKSNLCTINRKFIWFILVCVVVVYVSSLIQVGNLKKDHMELP